MLYKPVVKIIDWLLATRLRANIFSYAIVVFVAIAVSGMLMYATVAPGVLVKVAAAFLSALLILGTLAAASEISRIARLK